jgi:hypothetical protein
MGSTVRRAPDRRGVPGHLAGGGLPGRRAGDRLPARTFRSTWRPVTASSTSRCGPRTRT